MSQSHIRIRGARTHNLKNVSLDIPRDKFVVITGLSGSGKSSLAFDTLYAEGQRRYVESLSAYARQFLSQMEKPEVDSIEGLSPAIAIEQKSTSHNPRSTVGTITEIYDYLRLLYARVGTPYCPEHDLPMVAQTVSEMVDAVKGLEEGTALMLLAPVVRERKGEYTHLFEQLQSQGFVRARVDGQVIDIDTPPELDKKKKHTIEVVVDRFKVRDDLAQYLSNAACDACGGSRLNEISRHVRVKDKTIAQITKMSIGDAENYYQNLNLEGAKGEIADKIFKEIRERLHFLVSVGLNYLSLSRSAETLSGGEAQRIRLASQIGAGLMGVMYVLDEPSIGLHQRDNDRLLETLVRLRDLGNTVLVVEHDEDAIRAADHIIDIGPGAGIHGGHIIAEGTYEEILANPESLTGQYLSGKLKIEVPKQRVQPPKPDEQLKLMGAAGHNLQNVDLTIPLGVMTCVTGVSGSGKSTLINRTLLPLAATQLNGATTLTAEKFDSIDGLQFLDKVVDIDQSPIGRTPRSNPATYTGLFTPIRELFAQTPEAKARGYAAGRFSFNVKGGRCEACEGDGMIKVAMHFLPDMYVPCDNCHGARYNRETLEVGYKGKNISDVLGMTVEDAMHFFEAIPVIHRRLETLHQVGLSYIRLGQSATTLSGGEAQRVKLARELAKRDTGKTLYILDEPTTGLHFHDIAKLLDILHQLRNKGNTIIVIEHNLDVIKTADWVVDLGPEGGAGGGMIIAEGTPEHVAKSKVSHTAKFLKMMLK